MVAAGVRLVRNLEGREYNVWSQIVPVESPAAVPGRAVTCRTQQTAQVAIAPHQVAH
jgi:hypothetical protein